MRLLINGDGRGQLAQNNGKVVPVADCRERSKFGATDSQRDLICAPCRDRGARPRTRVPWVFRVGGAAVFYTLMRFLFGPVPTAAVGDPKQGQALWGYAAAAAGVLVAIGSPLLGAVADAGGRRKPWIAGFVALMLAGLCLLWVARPAGRCRDAVDRRGRLRDGIRRCRVRGRVRELDHADAGAGR